MIEPQLGLLPAATLLVLYGAVVAGMHLQARRDPLEQKYRELRARRKRLLRSASRMARRRG